MLIDAIGEQEDGLSAGGVAQHADRLGGGVEVGRAAAGHGRVNIGTKPFTLRGGGLLDAELVIEENQATLALGAQLLEEEPGRLLRLIQLPVVGHAAADVDGQHGRQGRRCRRQDLQVADLAAVLLDDDFLGLDVIGGLTIVREQELNRHIERRFVIIVAPKNPDPILRFAILLHLLLLDAIDRCLLLAQCRDSR